MTGSTRDSHGTSPCPQAYGVGRVGAVGRGTRIHLKACARGARLGRALLLIGSSALASFTSLAALAAFLLDSGHCQPRSASHPPSPLPSLPGAERRREESRKHNRKTPPHAETRTHARTVFTQGTQHGTQTPRAAARGRARAPHAGGWGGRSRLLPWLDLFL
jgi:hypothetical protein